MTMIMVVIARSLDCVVIRGTARAWWHWMGRLVTFVLEHIDKEAHRGVFVYVGERVMLVVTYLLLRLL